MFFESIHRYILINFQKIKKKRVSESKSYKDRRKFEKIIYQYNFR